MPFGTTGILPGRVDLIGGLDLTNHNANISHTAAATLVVAPPKGFYKILVYQVTRTALNATVKNLQMFYNDNQTTGQGTPVIQISNTVPGPVWQEVPIFVASGNITWSITNTGGIATGLYDLFIRVFAL